MSDATTEFFHELDGRGHEPLIGNATGKVFFEVSNGTRTDRWLVTLNKGNVSVSKKRSAADCTVRVDRALFDGVVEGSVNVTAAVLRGAVTVEGDPELLFRLQRLFPAPTKGAM
jgi:putative sterol carrier protein